MINIKNNQFEGPSKDDINTWEVWWLTPWGLFIDREEAINKVISQDLDPETTVAAVSVAVNSTRSYYEVFQR